MAKFHADPKWLQHIRNLRQSGRRVAPTPELLKYINEALASGVRPGTLANALSVRRDTILRWAGDKSVLARDAARTGRSLKPVKTIPASPPTQPDSSPAYDPKRDGVYVHTELVAQLMGDPPPGRRELIASIP